MAKLAEYKFTDYDGWVAAKSRLYDEVGSSSYTGESSGGYYWITIWDECNYPRVANQICEANGGVAYG